MQVDTTDNEQSVEWHEREYTAWVCFDLFTCIWELLVVASLHYQ